METAIHLNSATCYAETATQRQNLENRICGLMADGKARTDRQIASDLDYPEPLRPRITTLLQHGVLHEVGSTVCETTHKRVRVTRRFL